MNKELQDKVERDSLSFEEIVKHEVAKYTSSIDAYVKSIQDILNSDNPNIDDCTLEDILVSLPLNMYYLADKGEMAAIRKDIAAMLRDEKFSSVYESLIEGTVADKTAVSKRLSREEAVIESIYERVYKLIKSKYETADKLLDGCKKICTFRIKQMELGNKVTGGNK